MNKSFLYILIVSNICFASNDQSSVINRSLQHPQIAHSERELVDKLQKFLLVVFCDPNITTSDKYVRVDIDKTNAYPTLPLPCIIVRRNGDMPYSAIKYYVEHKEDIVTNKYSLLWYRLSKEKWDGKLFDPRNQGGFDDCL